MANPQSSNTIELKDLTYEQLMQATEILCPSKIVGYSPVLKDTISRSKESGHQGTTYTLEVPLDEFDYPRIAVCCGGILFTKDWICRCLTL